MNNSNLFIALPLFLGVLGAYLMQPNALYAQEKTEPPAEQQPTHEEAQEEQVSSTLETNYENIESAGLYANARDGGLGKDIWDNAHRSYLIGLIERLPQYTTSRTLRRLNKRALLTQTSAKLIYNDIEIEPGRDLLTVRLEKLLDIGLYAEAFDLYSLLNKEPYHEKLARAGILSMLYNGEKPLACLEANTFGSRFEGETFWQEFKAYCSLSMAENPDKEDVKILQASGKKVFQALAAGGRYNFAYAPQSFEKLSQLEQAILVSEKNLGTGSLGTIKYKDIPARHLALLLKDENISNEQRFQLSVQAVDKSILEPEDLKKLYLLSDAGEKPLDSIAQWQAPAYYLYKVKNQKDVTGKWNILSQNVFPLMDIYGPAALTPFAEMIQNLKPESPSLSDIGAVIRILHEAGLFISPDWGNALESLYSENIASSEEYKRLYLIAFLSKTNYRKSDVERERAESFLMYGKSSYTVFLNNIIENLDNTYEDGHNAPKVYEKDFDLTSVDGYVMPSVDVWDRLVLVSRNRNIGETILLSTFALQGVPMEKFYPGVLRNVLMSFNTVGLTNVSRELVVEALLEI